MKCYVVDAFSDKIFKGNPAAICVLEEWISDDLMQKIAQENNLSETAFTVKQEDNVYALRWFTPEDEIDLCGHATLATAFVLMSFFEKELEQISFQTKSGVLIVSKKEDLYELDMPAYHLEQINNVDEIKEAIGVCPIEVWKGRDLVCVLENEKQVNAVMINEQKVKALDGLLLHVTAKSKEYDCVTRSFAPKLGVLEDPVCGSGHCHVVPLWADKLNKTNLTAFQASRRSGTLYCRCENNRVYLAGKAVLYSINQLFI